MAETYSGPLAMKRRAADRYAVMRILYDAGWSDSRITRVLRTDPKTVTRWRARNNLAQQETSNPNTIDTAIALEMHRSGASDGQIAARLKVSQSGVSRWRYRNNLDANFDNHSIDAQTKRSMAKMLAEGASRKQVADEHGQGHLKTLSRLRSRISSGHLRETGITNKTIRNQVLKDRKLQDRIASAIGTHLPRDILYDAVASLYLDILEGRLDARLVESRAPRYRNQAFELNGHTFGTTSVDDDGVDGFSLLDRLDDPSALSDIYDAAEMAYDENGDW